MELAIITAIRYNKKTAEYVITNRSSVTGKTSKTYANHLTENETIFARSSKNRFEDETCVCWTN